MMAKSVGTQLRDGREAKQFSLDDLESLTGIRVSYLLAMEMDQFSLLPSKSYEISYIKKYAQAVDLNHEAILRDYHIAVAEKQERVAPKKDDEDELAKEADLSYSRSQASQQTNSHRQRRQSLVTSPKPFLLILMPLLAIIALVFGLFIFQNKHFFTSKVNQRQVSSSSSVSSSSQQTTSSSPSPSIILEPSTDGINLTAQLKNAKKPVDIVFTLTKDATDAWFSVSNSNYEAGASLSQETPTIRVALSQAVSETLITLGNPSGITVTANGQELDLSSLQAGTTSYITLRIE